MRSIGEKRQTRKNSVFKREFGKKIALTQGVLPDVGENPVIFRTFRLKKSVRYGIINRKIELDSTKRTKNCYEKVYGGYAYAFKFFPRRARGA